MHGLKHSILAHNIVAFGTHSEIQLKTKVLSCQNSSRQFKFLHSPIFLPVPSRGNGCNSVTVYGVNTWGLQKQELRSCITTPANTPKQSATVQPASFDSSQLNSPVKPTTKPPEHHRGINPLKSTESLSCASFPPFTKPVKN